MKAYKVGHHVKHGLYGTGTIVSSNEERTQIDFTEHGTKLFVTSLVRLEPAGAEEMAAAPSKKSARRRAGARKSRVVKVAKVAAR